MAKMEKSENLSEMADALGQIREQKAVLELKEKELSNYIKEHGEVGTTVHGKFFDADICQSNIRTIDPVKAFKKLGKDKFLRAASVTIKAASKIMSEEEIDALATIEPGSLSVRTKKRPVMRNAGTIPEGGEAIDIG